MKTGNLLKEKAVASPRKQKVEKASTIIKKSASFSIGNRLDKASGCDLSSFSVAQDNSSRGVVHCTCCKAQCSGKNETRSFFQLDQVETHNLPTRMKLQLFPLDNTVRRGLEKEGHNAFLELTLSPKKQISSVLNHLRNKWGGSSVAVGDPIFFPCDVSVENLASSRSWTLNHRGITAGDVHTAIGSPKPFCLRYGWSANQPSTCALSPSPTSFLGCTNVEDLEKVHNLVQVTTFNATKSPDITVRQVKSGNESEPANVTPVEQVSSAEMLNNEEQRTNDQKMLFLWSDGLSNISLGGLFSEASLQALVNPSGSKSNRGKSEFLIKQLMSESSDASNPNMLKCPQEQKNVYSDLSSSILDAEETCHSFAFLKSASSSQESLGKDGSVLAAGFRHNASTKFDGFPETTEVKPRDDLLGTSAYQEPRTNNTYRIGILNDDRSLELSDIRWCDSLGPFGLFHRSITGGNTDSLSGFVR